MTPIMKSGWNLYNVHPPVKIVRKRSKSTPSSSRGGLLDAYGRLTGSVPVTRRSVSLNAGSGDSGTSAPMRQHLLGGPVRSAGQQTNLNLFRAGHYQFKASSTDSLRMRDLDAVMSVSENIDLWCRYGSGVNKFRAAFRHDFSPSIPKLLMQRGGIGILSDFRCGWDWRTPPKHSIHP